MERSCYNTSVENFQLDKLRVPFSDALLMLPPFCCCNLARDSLRTSETEGGWSEHLHLGEVREQPPGPDERCEAGEGDGGQDGQHGGRGCAGGGVASVEGTTTVKQMVSNMNVTVLIGST